MCGDSFVGPFVLYVLFVTIPEKSAPDCHLEYTKEQRIIG